MIGAAVETMGAGWILAAALFALALVALLFPLDPLRRRLGSPPLPDARVDERDTMFARMARQPGSMAYEDYYTRHPQRQGKDDRLRSMPVLGDPEGLHFHPRISAEALDYFDAIDHIKPDAALVEREAARLAASSSPHRLLKGLARRLGAVAAGTTALDESFLYSHKGRLDEDYGTPVRSDHTHALVFLVEMDHEEMARAPKAETLRESAKQYWRAALVAMTITAVLQRAGQGASAQYDAHYEVILPPLAVRAGLGQVGRNNILVADRYGSRVRIGAVTTDLPLPQAKPRDLAVPQFCAICLKCADNCPSRALSHDTPVQVRGVSRWPTNVERCYAYWRRMGTDCGICMATCPYSHKNNALHNTVRFAVRLNPWLRRLAVWGDDRLYGRDWRSAKRQEA